MSNVPNYPGRLARTKRIGSLPNLKAKALRNRTF